MKKFVVVAVLCFTKALVGQTLSTSLVACYAFSGNANDAVNSLNGTLSSVTATVDRFNNPNSAYYFNGTNSSYVELPDNTLLKPTNALSFAAWIRMSSLSNPIQYVVFTKNNGFPYIEAYALVVQVNGSSHKLRLMKGSGSGSSNDFYGNTQILVNTWYHVAFTIDNSKLSLYLNGASEGTMKATYNFNYMAGKKIYLGGSNSTPYEYPLIGTIDNVRFYNQVLSPTEVNQLYLTDPSCVIEVTTSMNNTGLAEDVIVYPNPAIDVLNIELTNDESAEVNIATATGQLVYTTFITQTNPQINLSAFSKGLYFVTIRKGGASKILKVFKE